MSLMTAMKATAILSSLVLATPTIFAQDKIVGGEPVTSLSEAPYMASLAGVCGASVISNKWLLTAAHCAGYFSKVKTGVLNLKDAGNNYKVKRVIKHPAYDANSMANDFALVEIEGSMALGRKVSAVKLATPDFESRGNQAPGLDSTVYGWGLTSEGGAVSDKLNKVVVPLVSNEEANSAEAYNGAIDDTMIAAGYAGGGKDSCQGDSGGPLVVFDESNQPVQVGVVSWGQGCARANKYGIYSKVSVAYDWIKKTMANK